MKIITTEVEKEGWTFIRDEARVYEKSDFESYIKETHDPLPGTHEALGWLPLDSRTLSRYSLHIELVDGSRDHIVSAMTSMATRRYDRKDIVSLHLPHDSGDHEVSFDRLGLFKGLSNFEVLTETGLGWDDVKHLSLTSLDGAHPWPPTPEVDGDRFARLVTKEVAYLHPTSALLEGPCNLVVPNGHWFEPVSLRNVKTFGGKQPEGVGQNLWGPSSMVEIVPEDPDSFWSVCYQLMSFHLPPGFDTAISPWDISAGTAVAGVPTLWSPTQPRSNPQDE